jgi:hypothetical protein
VALSRSMPHGGACLTCCDTCAAWSLGNPLASTEVFCYTGSCCCRAQGSEHAAVEAYQAALGLNPDNKEAAAALEAMAQACRQSRGSASARATSDDEARDPVVAEDVVDARMSAH